MKVRLNLLPWREQRRSAAVRRFQAALLGGAMAALGLVLLVGQMAQGRVRDQQHANTLLQAQVTTLEQQLLHLDTLVAQREEVERRQAALVRLGAGQRTVPEVLAGLERSAPAGLQLTRLHLGDGQVAIAGLAATPALVARLVRELELLALLRDVEVKQIRSTPAGDRFEVVARLAAPWS